MSDTEPSVCVQTPSLPQSSASRRRGGLLLACAVSGLLGVVAFVPSLDYKFVYDDDYVVTGNPLVASPRLPWYRIWLEPYWPPLISIDKLYRPLTTFSWRANAWWDDWKLQARHFRMVNIAIHALTCIGVALLAGRLTGSAGAAALAGLLFATHPVHVEAVVPIYGRSELLAGCVAVWLLVLYIRPPAPGQRRSIGHMVLSSVLLLIGVMSKEHAILLWPVLMLIELWHRYMQPPARRKPFREWFNTEFAPSQVGLVLVCAVFLFFRYQVFGWKTHLEGARTNIYQVPMAHVGLIEHVLTPFRLLWVAVKNLCWPDSLCPVWAYPALLPADHLSADVLAGLLVALLLMGGIVMLWWRRNLVGALLLTMVIMLLIPIQAIPVANWFYAERWLYLPTVLLAVVVGWAVHRWGRLAMLAGAAFAMVLVPQTWQYASAFRDNLTMQHEVILRQPNNFQGRRNYAIVLWCEGHYPEAIQASNEIVERFGDLPEAYIILAKSYLKLGDGQRALDALKKHMDLMQNLPGVLPADELDEAYKLIARQKSATSSSAPATTTPQ